MDVRISELRERIRALENELELEFKRRRDALQADFEQRRVRFERDVLAQQRRFKTGLVRFLLEAKLRNVVTAPVIYPVFLALLALDLFVSVYQAVCFPLYRIPRVRRADYMIFDRQHLAYLNVIEKINCAYCSYANGLAAYVREVIARTEKYWCPIKHSRRVLQAHPYYGGFVDFADGAAYRRELQLLREELARVTPG